MTIFIRVVEVQSHAKSAALAEAVIGEVSTYDVSPRSFSQVPGSPFCYWASDQIKASFERLSRMDAPGRKVRQGLGTASDFRFVRAYWEVGTDDLNTTWRSFAKGGAYSQDYSEIPLVLCWDQGGAALKATIIAQHGSASKQVRSESYYFRPGLTWSRRSQKGLSFRAMPAGCIFADKGPAVFLLDDDEEQLLSLLAIANSSTFRYLVELQMAFGSYEVGVIQRTPVPDLLEGDRAFLAALTRRAHRLRWLLGSVEEPSHAFTLPSVLMRRTGTVDEVACLQELREIRSQIDDQVFDLYQISNDDRVDIRSGFAQLAPRVTGEIADVSENDEGATGWALDESPKRLISWLFGVAFGRFDIRLATGERPIPAAPGPFDPLPRRSPGMRPEGEELADRSHDILVDDFGNTWDISALVGAFGSRIGVDLRDDLRSWLAREFFPFHTKMYSKSRRKAPIYWQLATPSASYSVWLYIHSFTRDTMFRVQNDFVVPKLRLEENRLAALESEAGDRPTATARKEIDRQREFVAELRAFLDEVRRVAPLWDPDLDDGVLINFAPLWRVVPQHRPWQTELKKTWDELCAGKYDWAHLAMRLWPERVVPKCATDRSLAIAHGLEDVFWTERKEGWVVRTTPTRSLDDLIAERSSDAVRAALRALLDAPVTSPARGGRRRAATRATS